MTDDCGCDDLVSRLFQLFDAELEASECSRLRQHLEGCPQCSELADAEDHVRNLIRRSCVEHAPESLRVRVITQLTVLRSERHATGEF